MPRDIETREDIVTVLKPFYKSLFEDEQVEHIFQHLDMEEHIEVISQFWDSMLLGNPGYQGNPLVKHFPLGLQPEHFEVWLGYFRKHLRENFTGEVVEKAILRAESIAVIFQRQLCFK